MRPTLHACLRLAAFALPSLGLVACGNNYHPEYHPVSVSEVSQNLTYPMTVHNAPSVGDRGAMVIAPGTPGQVWMQGPPMPVLAQPPQPQAAAPLMAPGDWFRGY